MSNWTDKQWCEYIYHTDGFVMPDGYGNKIYMIDVVDEEVYYE